MTVMIDQQVKPATLMEANYPITMVNCLLMMVNYLTVAADQQENLAELMMNLNAVMGKA